jgi:hypothetical protein
LHGLCWELLNSVIIDQEEGVVAYILGSALTLRDHTQRDDAQVAVVQDKIRWQQDQLPLFDHVYKLATQEVHMLFG